MAFRTCRPPPPTHISCSSHYSRPSHTRTLTPFLTPTLSSSRIRTCPRVPSRVQRAGTTARHTFATTMNPAGSSRGTAIFTLVVRRPTGEVSKLNFVDMAGTGQGDGQQNDPSLPADHPFLASRTSLPCQQNIPALPAEHSFLACRASLPCPQNIPPLPAEHPALASRISLPCPHTPKAMVSKSQFPYPQNSARLLVCAAREMRCWAGCGWWKAANSTLSVTCVGRMLYEGTVLDNGRHGADCGDGRNGKKEAPGYRRMPRKSREWSQQLQLPWLRPRSSHLLEARCSFPSCSVEHIGDGA
jgi:hypothetical protein